MGWADPVDPFDEELMGGLAVVRKVGDEGRCWADCQLREVGGQGALHEAHWARVEGGVLGGGVKE